MTGSSVSAHSGEVGDLFDKRLKAAAAATDAALTRLLTDMPGPGEIARPGTLLASMRYAVLGPGKRLRPFLLIETARFFGTTGTAVTEAAAALECVHAYSLAHDDLPAMDDDDLRRGRPTLHRAFDEATAILAGDALLTLAFAILARIEAPASVRVRLVDGLAAAAGMGGMVGGQMLDMAAEGTTPAEAEIRRLQAMKTGALIRYATEAGAILGRAKAAERKRLGRFGELVGLAFQLKDDLIDATGEAATAGKATAKDAGRGKATLVALHGTDAARALLDRTVAEAITELAPFGRRAAVLRDAARFVAERRS